LNYNANLELVTKRIKNACDACGRNPEDLTLIAVSKMHEPEAIRTVHALGHTHFGENKVQELVSKMEDIPLDSIKWHMIGTLQTNKIKYLVDRVDWIHSVPKKKSLKEIQKRASRIDRVINVLIQVNISDEDQKSGCEPDDLPALLDYADSLSHVQVYGLMGISAFEEDPEVVRPQFRLLRELRDREAERNREKIRMDHLSMGMTHDLEVAIEEGATMVRVGTAIFGERDYS